MKIYKYITSVAILSFCFLSACNKPTETKIPVPVIFDTDVGNDIDDVLAMQMLFNYEKAGTIDLLGITISKSNPYSIEYIDGYCRLNERRHSIGICIQRSYSRRRRLSPPDFGYHY